jgi:hypothetical protein
MKQLYWLAYGHEMPRRICGLDRAGPAPFSKAPMVPALVALKDAARGRAPGLSRQCIIGWIGIVGLA